MPTTHTTTHATTHVRGAPARPATTGPASTDAATAPTVVVADAVAVETSLDMSLDGDRPRNLSHRDRAILRAVARGGAELLVSSEPDLFLDGRCCSDQAAAHALVRAGLIAGSPTTDGGVNGGVHGGPAGFGQRVAARLTATGQRTMAGQPAGTTLAGGGAR